MKGFTFYFKVDQLIGLKDELKSAKERNLKSRGERGLKPWTLIAFGNSKSGKSTALNKLSKLYS